MTSVAVTEFTDRRATQVRKIIDSRVFQHAEALKRLLDYLACRALENHACELKEYTVGVEAFGKPADYDPQLDSSVRVQAGKLRQKLEEYYRTEGTADEFIVHIPKGHFKVQFQPRAKTASILARVVRWATVFAILVLAGVSAGLYVEKRTQVSIPGSAVWTPDMEELWRPFLSSSRPVMVAIGTPLFVKIGGDFFRSPSLNAWENTAAAQEIRGIQRAVGSDTVVPAFPYTGIGEAEGAFELGRVLLMRNRDTTVRASSQLTWEEINGYNMIFLGPPKYVQQTLDLPVHQDFEIMHARVENLRPQVGEPLFFEEKYSADHVHLEEGHALISRLPGLHRSGEMLILAGSSTESTRAAVEYVTRPEYVSSLIRKLHAGGAVPKWFQLVIHVRYKSQTPIAMEPTALHALK